MAIHSSQVTLWAKWRRGWALMHDGKTTEGYDLLSRIKVGDLLCVDDPDHPDGLLTRIRSIIDRDPHPETDAERTVMEVLIAASKGGDDEASDLLVFGDLGSREVAD